jgi:hypothetical protein
VASLDIEPDEDTLRVNALIVGSFGCVAGWRQYPGWQLDPNDALCISRPLMEILNKYPKVADKVLGATGPLALLAALGWMIGPRIVADKMYHQELQRAAAAEARRAPPPPSGPYQAGAQTVPPVPPMPPQGQGQNAPPTGFPKDLDFAARMWSDDANGRAADGLPVL